MTEFEIIKKALARVRADITTYDFPQEKTIVIPVHSCFADIDLDLEFDGEGKLTDIFTRE